MVRVPLSLTRSDPRLHSPVLQGLTNDRQQEILKLARAAGRVTVEDLAARFEVTPQTIRKDLNDLCERRLLSRVHGGAVISSGVSNLAYQARRFVAQVEKEAIGAAAAKHIPNRASLFINIGTTTEEVAKALGGHEDLLVITNNLNVATLLYPNPNIDVIVAGGPVRRSDGAVVGEATVQSVITGIEGIGASIAAAVDEQDASTREIARGLHVAADSSTEAAGLLATVTETAATVGRSASETLTAAQVLRDDTGHLSTEVDHFVTKVRAAV